MTILNKILNEILHKYRLNRTRSRWTKEEKKHLSNTSFPVLTKDEILEIKRQWEGFKVTNRYLNEYRFYKKIHGFDSRYLAMPIYDPVIIRRLNPIQDASVFVNKGLFDIFFRELKQPVLYLKKINEHYFNGNSNLISKSEAIELLCQKERFIIKPSINSHGGAGIKLFNEKITYDDATKILEEYKSDIIVQEIVRQHIDTAKFNPESLNTIRIISLFINGEVKILKSALRCGQNGAEVDNATSGGLMIKINDDGNLESFGIDSQFKKILTTHNGVILKGQEIRNFHKLKNIITTYHPKLYPTLHLIAWDFALDEFGNPVFIEGNTKVPGIFWMQMCAGAIFGNHTDEVVDYIKNK